MTVDDTHGTELAKSIPHQNLILILKLQESVFEFRFSIESINLCSRLNPSTIFGQQPKLTTLNRILDQRAVDKMSSSLSTQQSKKMGGTNKKKRQSPSTTENASAKEQKASKASSSSPSSLLSARYITYNDTDLINNNNNNNNNNEGLLFAFVKFMDLPVPIRVSIF